MRAVFENAQALDISFNHFSGCYNFRGYTLHPVLFCEQNVQVAKMRSLIRPVDIEAAQALMPLILDYFNSYTSGIALPEDVQIALSTEEREDAIFFIPQSSLISPRHVMEALGPLWVIGIKDSSSQIQLIEEEIAPTVEVAPTPEASLPDIPSAQVVEPPAIADSIMNQAIEEVHAEIAEMPIEPLIRDKSKGKAAFSSSYGLIPSPERPSSSSDSESDSEAKDFRQAVRNSLDNIEASCSRIFETTDRHLRIMSDTRSRDIGNAANKSTIAIMNSIAPLVAELSADFNRHSAQNASADAERHNLSDAASQGIAQQVALLIDEIRLLRQDVADLKHSLDNVKKGEDKEKSKAISKTDNKHWRSMFDELASIKKMLSKKRKPRYYLGKYALPELDVEFLEGMGFNPYTGPLRRPLNWKPSKDKRQDIYHDLIRELGITPREWTERMLELNESARLRRHDYDEVQHTTMIDIDRLLLDLALEVLQSEERIKRQKN